MSFSPRVIVMTEGEKNGGASSKGWAESAPLVGIGLTDLSNMGGGGTGITEGWSFYECGNFYDNWNVHNTISTHSKFWNFEKIWPTSELGIDIDSKIAKINKKSRILTI